MKYTLGIYAFAAILSLVLTASADEAKYEYAFDTSGAPELAEWKGRRGVAKAPAVRVMTYNVRCEGGDRKSKDNNWPSRRVDFAHVIERENPDVMGFQEVEPGQLKWLKGRFPDFEFSGRGRNAGGGGESSPVAYRKSRFELVRTGTFWLSETPDVPGSKGWDAALPRICTYAVLKDKATGKTFSFANTHTDHKGVEAREKGMLLVIDRMKEFGKGAPIVFTGDHNCLEHEAPARAVAKIMTDALYLSETPPEGSWRTFNAWTWHEKEMSITEALKKPVGSRSMPGGQVEREAHRLHLCLAGDEGSRLPHRAVDAPEFAPLSFRPLPERRYGRVQIAARRTRRGVPAGGQVLK